MDERLERCLKCGKQQGLQGVALTIGVKTFHLFYLCNEYDVVLTKRQRPKKGGK